MILSYLWRLFQVGLLKQSDVICIHYFLLSYSTVTWCWARRVSDRPSVADWGMVCLLAAPWVQLSVSAGNVWPHNALRHHWLMPISCHLRDCKTLLVTSLTHVSVSSAITSVPTFTFSFRFFVIISNCVLSLRHQNRLHIVRCRFDRKRRTWREGRPANLYSVAASIKSPVCYLFHQPTYSQQNAAADDADDSYQRWRTLRCRMMSGTTSRHPRRKTMAWRSCILPTSVTLHSKSSTSLSELSASLTTCLSSSFLPCSSR